MRTVWGLVVVGGVLAGCSSAGCGDDGGAASCVAPEVTVSPQSADLGGTVQVSGRYFLDGCADTNCSPPAHPLTDIRVTLTPEGAGAREIGRVDAAGELGTFDVPLRIPVDLPTGPATVTVGSAAPFRVTVE